MYLAADIALFTAGMLGASGMLMDRLPGLRRFLTELRKYHLIIGMVNLILGIVLAISLLDLSTSAGIWIMRVLMAVLMVSLGLVQGYSSLTDMIKFSPRWQERVADARRKLWNYEETLGILGMIAAVVHLLFG